MDYQGTGENPGTGGNPGPAGNPGPVGNPGLAGNPAPGILNPATNLETIIAKVQWIWNNDYRNRCLFFSGYC